MKGTWKKRAKRAHREKGEEEGRRAPVRNESGMETNRTRETARAMHMPVRERVVPLGETAAKQGGERAIAPRQHRAHEE